MVSFELEDKEGLERLVEIFPIDTDRIRVVVDDEDIVINPNLFKHRKRLEEFCLKIFEEREASEILAEIYASDEFEEVDHPFIEDVLDNDRHRIRKFKDGSDI